MAENIELNMINHLFEVEKAASILINDAAEEADKRISAAKAEYNEKYKQKYDEVVEQLKNQYEKSISECSAAHEKILSEYQSKLESKQQDFSAFSTMLDKFLFEKA